MSICFFSTNATRWFKLLTQKELLSLISEIPRMCCNQDPTKYGIQNTFTKARFHSRRLVVVGAVCLKIETPNGYMLHTTTPRSTNTYTVYQTKDFEYIGRTLKMIECSKL